MLLCPRIDSTLRRLRLERGLSRRQLRNITGISYKKIGYFETRGLQPRLDELFRLSTALKCSPFDLVGGRKLLDSERVDD